MACRYDPNELLIYGAQNDDEMDSILGELDRALREGDGTIRLSSYRRPSAADVRTG